MFDTDVAPTNDVIDIDYVRRVVTIQDGSEVDIVELQELRPGLWGYMAGPTPDGQWLVGQYILPEEDKLN